MTYFADAPTHPALTHRFADLFPELSLAQTGRPTRAPRLLTLNTPLATELGLGPDWLATDDGLRFLTGEAPGPHARPVAQGYAGHQFGGYSPVLGDGRALLLGELTAPNGQLADLHLKGSGRTGYARPGADGMAAVGPMLREHVISEFLHATGVPAVRRRWSRRSTIPGRSIVGAAIPMSGCSTPVETPVRCEIRHHPSPCCTVYDDEPVTEPASGQPGTHRARAGPARPGWATAATIRD